MLKFIETLRGDVVPLGWHVSNPKIITEFSVDGLNNALDEGYSAKDY